MSYRYKSLAWLSAAALFLVLRGAGERTDLYASQAPPPTRQAPAVRTPLATGPDADLNIVFTAQVAGWIEPCG